MRRFIEEVGKKVLEGKLITYEEALPLTRISGSEIMDLAVMAHQVREVYCGKKVDLCSLCNAKSGRCSEDCAFCAQSAHYRSPSPTYPLKEVTEMVAQAKEAEKRGAKRFCIITSGRDIADFEFDSILRALEKIERETSLKLDCSLGFLTLRQAKFLKEVGVSRYNHNLETAKSHFAKICTTHSFDERFNCARMIKEVGLNLCCGGIIGMGETPEQRLELAFLLRELKVDCIPINILNPRPETPLEQTPLVPPSEIIKTISIFRLINPGVIIKLAGGRELNLRDFQALGLLAGANGLIMGGYLTTAGRDSQLDLQMVEDMYSF